MEARSISEIERLEYLLGLCLPAERERIESEYFEDDVAFQQMLTAEDDLIDAYARGELVAEERWRFEKSFASSLRGRERVKFARAFAGVGTPARSVESSLRIFRSRVLLQTATIAATIVLVALFAWLINDRRRMSTELRELHTEHAEFIRRTQELHRSDNEQLHTTKGVLQVRNKIACCQSKHAEKPVNHSVATLGNTLVNKNISELPLEASDMLNLLTLQPATPRNTPILGRRFERTNITLDGIDVLPLNSYSLTPTNTHNGQTTIFIPSTLNWIRFQLTLKRAAIHEDYRVTIKATDDRTVTSVDWTEPLTPNQTTLDTPVISPRDLPSADYVLVLMGKESDGSFVKVADYAFKVIKYD